MIWRTAGSTGRILFLIGASGAATLALIVFAAVWAGSESDIAAFDRQRQLVTARLLAQVDQVARDIDQIAVGYSSLLSPTSPSSAATPDEAVAAGSSTAIAASRLAISVFGYDDAFVVDGAEVPVARGDREMERRFKWIRPLIKPLLAEVRRAGGKAGATGAAPVQSLSTDRAAIAHLMRLQGRPTIVGVVPIRVGRFVAQGGHESATDTAYLVVIRFLDGAALDELSREQGLTGARFARSADAEGKEVAFQIDATETGEPIGFIIWNPDLPGSRVVGRLVPALSFAGLILALLFSLLLVRLRKSLNALKSSEHQSRHLAFHDVLTGLPNRAFFGARLDACLGAGDGRPRRSALVLIDLDRFKIVNDTYGHAAGDELIRQAADRMRASLRPSDLLARLGGDEFALLVEGIGPTDDVIVGLVEEILSRLNEAFVLLEGKVAVHIGASLGIAILPDVGIVPDDLMRFADVALYNAKNTGRGRWVTFEPSMDNGRNERELLRSDLRKVLGLDTEGTALTPSDDVVMLSSRDCGALEVHFQPIHRAADSALTGAEALVRWRHGEKGLLPPDRFIALAEESGLIDQLGLHVLSDACRAAVDWPADMFVAVNVSPAQLRNPNFVDAVLAVLAETGIAPRRLELELTESALLRDDHSTALALSRLRAEGIQLALDDFGTGFSSLSHLIHFSIDRIKIDRSFVALLGTKANGAAIVAAVVSLARSLGLSTTAEGVETDGQRAFLSALGSDDLQGYSFAKPMPKSEFTAYVAAMTRVPTASCEDGSAAA